MRTFIKLLLSDLKQFYRDRTALFFTFAFPLLFMMVFGLAFSGDNGMSYEIGLVDEDRSPASEQISTVLKQVSIFDVEQVDSLDQELVRLKKGYIRGVVVIPAGAQANIVMGKVSSITVYYDPSQSTSSSIILSTLNQIANQINQQLTNQPVLIQVEEQSVQTHDLRYIDYLVPGILAMSILFLGLFGSLTMVERREKKVLKRFGATPVGRTKLLASQVVYRLILAIIQASLIIVLASLVFEVTVIGSWFELFGIILLGTLAFISIGYFVVVRARTVEGAMPIIQLVQFPMLFLSGIFFPVEMMPTFMRPVVNALPLTYVADALRQIMVQGVPLNPMWLNVAVLGAWLVVCVTLAIRFFKWE
ncbi:MAG: ABC transporter permease [Dehalococcoidales bacterium]|jgi:ABC-2 type transport system permease protein|nr:ABC transporter permease [Dehalococcoidales bacterium]MDP6737755.1 ABC transporter permease [Dehalococcoidales bacterium]|tara:strand:- start:1701 stop:2786 length:1086 start_codon:yes stop_codon:yes gene_type:complete